MTATQIQKIYKELVDAKLKSIQTLEHLEKQDEVIAKIMGALRGLYRYNLDEIPDQMLLRIGGQLLGLYANLGVSASIKRAERDCHEEAYDELLNGLILEKVASGMGVTESRASAKNTLAEAKREIVMSEQQKNSYESIVQATSQTISFIQSAIKIKNTERVMTPRFGDETV